jgi:outer membrane lipoprotein SlyB
MGQRFGWLGAGVLGGGALGATVAGHAGAAIGTIVGAAAGLVRATTGRTMIEHWSTMSFQVALTPQPLKPASKPCAG